MCKDCGCGLKTHTHEHTHENGLTHSHEHTHENYENHAYLKHNHDHPVLNESKTIDVMSKILVKNDEEAAHIRNHFDEKGIFCVNLMSSPGAGKTTLLEATIKSGEFNIAVIEGDLETNKDANRIIKVGAKAHQITTGQSCHLDAFMVHDGLHHLDLNGVNLAFIENVGNLVCPASYDVGAHINAVLLSTPEGSDKVAKYPVMFRAADVVIITKISLMKHFDFDLKAVMNDVKKLNPKADIIALDSISGENVDKWINYLKMKMELR